MRAANLSESHADVEMPGMDPATADTYECVPCGTHWAYPEIQNTGRCPACGGGLLRDPVVTRRP